jgi:polysaccharide export outer membrane protein
MMRGVTLRVGIAFALLASCLRGYAAKDEQATAAPSSPVQASGKRIGGAAGSGSPVLQRRNPRYRLSPTDSFDLTFPLCPEFNQIGSSSSQGGSSSSQGQGGVIVQPDGYVSLAGVGDVYVAGKTVPELTETIKAAYSKILHDPMVQVTLRDFEKPYFTALGQVGKPGKYDLRGEITLAEAVAIAGGFTTVGAKTSQVLLFRQVSDDWVEVRKFDAKKMLKGQDLREDVQLRPGDMIFVPSNVYSKVEPYIPKLNMGLFFNPANW